MLFLCLTSTLAPTAPAAALDDHLSAIARGDKAALAALYHATRDGVYGFALSLLRSPHDAEDVLQETYLLIWGGADRYQSQGKPMAWILTCARNLCLQKLRERQKQADLPQEDWEPWLRAKEGMTAEDKVILAECMTQLTDEERQIVVLHAVGGLKHREIAAMLEKPLSTVLSKYARALRKLRQHL